MADGPDGAIEKPGGTEGNETCRPEAEFAALVTVNCLVAFCPIGILPKSNDVALTDIVICANAVVVKNVVATNNSRNGRMVFLMLTVLNSGEQYFFKKQINTFLCL